MWTVVTGEEMGFFMSTLFLTWYWDLPVFPLYNFHLSRNQSRHHYELYQCLVVYNSVKSQYLWEAMGVLQTDLTPI